MLSFFQHTFSCQENYNVAAVLITCKQVIYRTCIFPAYQKLCNKQLQTQAGQSRRDVGVDLEKNKENAWKNHFCGFIYWCINQVSR